MFIKSKNEAKIDEEIARQLSLLKITETDEGHNKIMSKIERLQKLRAAEMRPSYRVSPDTLAMAFTNLAGIFMIIKHERFEVISTKSLGFVKKAG
jgi:hypothetical protein